LRRIIGHALDSLTPAIRDYVGVVQRSAREITFASGSYIRVDTTLRGGSYNYLLVSEYGKTCARDPLKAEEVLTGSIQAVSTTGTVIIESTGEGTSGYFADIVQQAAARDPTHILGPLDYKLFFFPWYSEPTYRLDYANPIDTELGRYLDAIPSVPPLNIAQRSWYAAQAGQLGALVKREYPSSVSEAFLSASDAYYYASEIDLAYKDRRVLQVNPYDPLSPVYAAADIGVNDATVIVVFQNIHGQISVIDVIADRNKGIDHYARELQQRTYLYAAIYLPHDASHRDNIIVENTYAREMRQLFSHTTTKVIVLPKTEK